uniref:CD151 antigen-like n=1 Tax=Styela clava TaxID=7725 RepID=UPI0019399ABF|nr:CD151 antigen-like [Styela clava]
MQAKEKCLKTTCIVLQIICFIAGAVVLGLGIWAIHDDSLTKLIDKVMFAGMYVLIVAGAVIILTTILAFVAIWKKSKPMVVIYCIIALIAIFLKVVACIIIFDYFVTAHWSLVDSYKEEYGVKNEVTDIWDEIQSKGECCGLLKYWDWEESTFYADNDEKYPESCCKLVAEGEYPIHKGHCQIGRDGYIHIEGCEYLLEKYYYGIGGTAVAIIIIELFAVVMIACLYQYYP